MRLVTPRMPARGPKAKVRKPPAWVRKSPACTAARLNALIESTRDMIWSVDLKYRLVTFNKAVSDQFKYNHGIKVKAGMRVADLLAPERAALWPPLFERALKEGPFQTEYRMADGRYLELELNPIVENGKKTGVWVFSKDITERRASQQSLASTIEALRATEERYHAAFETCTDSITISRMSDGMFLDVNKVFLEFFGYSREEVVGRTVMELGIWPEPHEREVLLEAVRREGKCRDLEVHTRLKNGEIIWTLLSATTIKLDGTTCLLSVGRDITEQKAAQQSLAVATEALRASEARYHAAFQTSTDPITISRMSDGVFLDANNAFLNQFGYSRKEEVVGRTTLELGIWAEPRDFEMLAEIVRREGKCRNLEVQGRLKNGEIIWTLLSATTFELDGTTCVLGASKDITERKRAEKELAEYQGKLAAALASMTDSVCVTDASGEAINYNDAFATFHRFKSKAECPTSLSGMRERVEALTPDGKVVPPDERAASRALRGETAANVEYNMRRRDTGETWIGSFSFSPIRSSDGSIVGAVIVARDITQQKAAQEALQRAEERFREIFTSAPEGIFQASPAGKVLAVNPAGAIMLGYSPFEDTASVVPDLAHNIWLDPRECARFREGLEKHGEIQGFSCQVKCKDGAIKWVSISARKICGADGNTLYYQGFIEDLTSRMAAEDARRKAEQRFREIFEDAPEGIQQSTPEGRILALNPAAAKMLGYESTDEAAAAIQDAAHDLWVCPEERTRFVTHIEQHGTVHDFQCQLKRKDGRPIWISTTAKKIAGPDGKTICYQDFSQDITEQKRLEAALKANSRELQLLSEINNTLVRAKTEKDLLRNCCRIMVEVGGYRTAWVGFAGEGPDKPIVTIADYGFAEGFLEGINLTWAENGHEDGPVGRSLRTGEVQVEEEICADPLVHSWRTDSVKHGYRMAIALPFRLTDGAIASLAVFGDRPGIRTGSERRLMEQIASDLAYGIANQRAEIAKSRHQEDLRAALEQTIHVIAETVDQRDPYTAGHERRVADLCVRIAQKLGLSDDRTHGLHLAASIHDLGKIGIPAEILSKPGLLTRTQYNLLKEHAQLGYDILKNVAFPWPIADMVVQHHERLDGSGYPQGLKADALSLESRILALADVVEAMSSHRPYRAAQGIDVALDEIIAQRGKLFDSEVVDACVRIFREDGYSFPAQAC